MDIKGPNLYYIISISLLATGFACIHIHHVSTLFENDRHFSHLSNLEREMTFRTEMGFYYYYYKQIVNAHSFEEGLLYIMQDNRTEHPDVINALQRFNLYPEIIMGGLYRIFDTVTQYFNITTKQCWEVSRGPTISPVNSCEGLGDAMYFYLELVWCCAGISVAALFIFAVTLSDSFSGGFLAVLSFFYNHGHATRIQWTPPLRESFAYPFCLLQMLAVTSCLKSTHEGTQTKWKIFSQAWTVTTLTAVSLILWQFSQFVIATQTISLLIIFCIGIINKKTLLIIVICQLVGLLQAAIMLFGNVFLFQSILFSLLLATVAVIIGFNKKFQNPAFNAFFILSAVCGITISLKIKISQFFGAHDSHVLDLLASKISSYKNFHTMLYTCSAEFDFLPFSTIRELSITGLIPTVVLVIGIVIFNWKRNLLQLFKKKKPVDVENSVQPDIAYNLLQLGAFTIMCIFIMRLKLFWSPHLCLIASLVMSPKFSPFKGSLRYSLFIGIVAAMSYYGISNVLKQRSIMGEYVNIPFEEVLTWINSETLETDVFAGPMSVMANILLSTGRRIVNHPHYEDQRMRERTMKVYSIFSRQNPKQVYSTLAEMGVDYVVLDEAWCFPRSKENCSMVDLWDLVDSDNRKNESLCPRLFEGDPVPFIRVFANEVFVILSLKTRQSIEITPIQQYQI